MNVKIPVNTANGHTSLPDNVIVGPKQKMNWLSTPAESGAVETTERPTADHGDLHL
jgi:hypothetical protein